MENERYGSSRNWLMRSILLCLTFTLAGCFTPKEVNTAPTPPTDFTVEFAVVDDHYRPVEHLTVLLLVGDQFPTLCEYVDVTVTCTVKNELYGFPADFLFVAPHFSSFTLTTLHLWPRLQGVQMEQSPYPTYDPTSPKELL